MTMLPRGFRFAGIHSGIRPDPSRLDLAVIASSARATAAGVFTQNRVAAAPVRVSRDRVPSADTRGIVICSGNANACTGQQGIADAKRMAALTAQGLGCAEEQVLVCSTGVIGRPLPMHKIEAGIPKAIQELADSQEAFDRAQRAILTTDTRPKVSSQVFNVDTETYRVVGFAKGAAMIGPNMATMLAFVMTDAPAPADFLTNVARTAADRTFNCVSVEGHTSTNDTLLVLANGSGEFDRSSADSLQRCIHEVCADLARAIAADAEGAEHFVSIEVVGTRDDAEAKRIAKTIADSALVKTAIFGADPNWGRIVSATGYSGVEFEEEQLSLWLGDIPLYRAGVPLPFDAGAASAYLKNNRDISVKLEFTLGSGRCTFWTSDLTYEYVKLNADYTT